MPKILIIEDEAEMAMGLGRNLEYEGYEIMIAEDGEKGLQIALKEYFDLILLDVMLPKLSGMDVCRRLRGSDLDTPIIMLTARGQEIDKVLGLEVGADDYVTKPFGVRELLARVHVQLRRRNKPKARLSVFRFKNIELNFGGHRATKDGNNLELSPREFEILRYLIERSGETVTREQLLDDVWGYNNFPITRTVDNHIARLRQKIEENPAEPQIIITVHRIGYKFIP
jgi:DNA-binding response OmpR family regulator